MASTYSSDDKSEHRQGKWSISVPEDDSIILGILVINAVDDHLDDLGFIEADVLVRSQSATLIVCE